MAPLKKLFLYSILTMVIAFPVEAFCQTTFDPSRGFNTANPLDAHNFYYYDDDRRMRDLRKNPSEFLDEDKKRECKIAEYAPGSILDKIQKLLIHYVLNDKPCGD